MIAGLVAAIITRAVKGHAVERLAADHPRHRIGQLDLAAGALFLPFEHAHHFGLEDVAADHRSGSTARAGPGFSTRPFTSVSDPSRAPGVMTP
jgi:hypothetical protein